MRPWLSIVLCLAACVADDDPRVMKRATQGVVVRAPQDDVWAAVQAVLPGARSAGVPMSAVASVRGQAVEARVERYNDSKTVLHVTCADPALAEEVQLAVQRALMR